MSATVVTCYYKIKSKHSPEEYDEWLTNFLSNIECNLVIFTSPDLKDYLLDKRPDHLKSKTHIICEEIHELELAKKYENYWDYQYSIDNQQSCGRTKECYILWNSKLWFLKKAIELNIFQSDKYVWTDIGCFRHSNYELIQVLKNYPDYNSISNNKIDIILIYPIKYREQYYFLDEVHFSGSIFGSHKDVLLKFYDLFYNRFDEFIQKSLFIGCDQQIFSSIYNTNPELINDINPRTVTENTNIYYYGEGYFILWLYYSKVYIPIYEKIIFIE